MTLFLVLHHLLQGAGALATLGKHHVHIPVSRAGPEVVIAVALVEGRVEPFLKGNVALIRSI